MTTPDENPQGLLVQRLRERFVPTMAVREVRMFGGVSFMVDDRMAVSAGPSGDLLVRAHPTRYDEYLQRGAIPALMGGHRPMGRGWITVPSDVIGDTDVLDFWVQVGIDSRSD